MNVRRYLAIILIVAVIAPVSTAGFNLLVDPYDFRGVLGLSTIDPNRMNLFGPEAPVVPEWMGMTYNVRWYRPDTVVIGSSSSGGLLGADSVRNHPHHKFGSRIFHFSVAGPSIGAVKNYFLHTATLGPPQTVVLELHFFMFNADRYKPNDEYFSLAPFAHRPDYEDRFLRSLLQKSVEKQTTRDSMDLLLRRLAPGWSLSRVEQQWAMLGANPPAPAPASSPADVTPEEFRRQFMTVERAVYIGLYHLRAGATFRFQDETGYNTFDDLREILQEARRRRIKLRVYLAPSHARMYEMISFDGRWPMFEEWKRTVVSIFAADAAAHPGDPIALWDFAGHNSVTMDAFPEQAAAAPALAYFLDTVHWNARVRDFIVARLFAHDAGEPVPEDFGVLLTPSNIESEIARTRAVKQRYEERHREELAALRAVLSTVP